MTVDRKVDIFEVLNAINSKNVKFFELISSEQLKTVQPFVVMRWLTGTDDERQIILLNEFVNHIAFDLAAHKQLLIQMLSVCSSGVKQRYQWVKQSTKTAASKPIATELIRSTYGYNTPDAIAAVSVLSDDAILEMAVDAGTPAEVITKLKKELKK